MKLAYAAPPTDLTPYLSHYYLFELGDGEFEDLERADIAQLRYFLSGSGAIVFPDGARFENTPVTLFGPRMSSSRILCRGPMRVFGFGLQPAGWAASTGMSASTQVNRCIDAADVWGDVPEATRKALIPLTTVEEMAAVLSESARRFYAEAESVAHWFIRAVDAWLEERLTPDIADLEAATGLSRRQIERLAKQYYGAPPKVLVRKYRALRTANAIQHGRGDWQDFVDEGYYDQSHCIREIKEFTGTTPSALRDQRSLLTSMTRDRSNLMSALALLSDEA